MRKLLEKHKLWNLFKCKEANEKGKNKGKGKGDDHNDDEDDDNEEEEEDEGEYNCTHACYILLKIESVGRKF